MHGHDEPDAPRPVPPPDLVQAVPDCQPLADQRDDAAACHHCVHDLQRLVQQEAVVALRATTASAWTMPAASEPCLARSHCSILELMWVASWLLCMAELVCCELLALTGRQPEAADPQVSTAAAYSPGWSC